MKTFEWIMKSLMGNREGTLLWKIPLGEIECEPISDPAEGVAVASLAENILKVGLLQPLLVWKSKSASNGTRYRLVAGRRRYEALRMLGKTHANAIIADCKEEDLPLLALSDNYMHRECDPFWLSESLLKLSNGGYEISRLSRLLGAPSSVLESQLAICKLSAEEQRLLRLCNASLQDVLAYLGIPETLRETFLHRALEQGTSLWKLAEDFHHNPIATAMQTRKVWSADLRLFVNTLQRSVQTMESAGFSCGICHEELEDETVFTIRLRKSDLSDRRHIAADLNENVPRETFSEQPQCDFAADDNESAVIS